MGNGHNGVEGGEDQERKSVRARGCSCKYGAATRINQENPFVNLFSAFFAAIRRARSTVGMRAVEGRVCTECCGCVGGGDGMRWFVGGTVGLFCMREIDDDGDGNGDGGSYGGGKDVEVWSYGNLRTHTQLMRMILEDCEHHVQQNKESLLALHAHTTYTRHLARFSPSAHYGPIPPAHTPK